ncbi:MAG: hypothetical protein ICV87_06350 [Gemmatimonadetes bacterium]|nr:hypothetical protein [Gemmatimonadota bacterium]
MKTLHLLLLASVLLAALPYDAAAQAAGGRKLEPFVGLAAGGSKVPDAFVGCSHDPRVAGEMRAGVALGALALEGRAAGLFGGGADCAVILREELRPPGIHPAVEYPSERGDMHSMAELRVRYELPSDLPFVVALGAGWLAPQDAPYLVTSAGVRTGGRVRLTLDLDYNRYRVPYDVVVRETSELGETGPALASTRHHDWRGGVGLRVGTEVSLR